jgi:glutaredoxin
MTETAQKVIIYTTPNCGGCDRARARLVAEGVDFEERNIMLNKRWYDDVLKHSISVPVIIRGDKVEVGRGGCLIY